METVFIEFSKDQLQINKNILITVIYRPPARYVRSFNVKLNIILVRKENKICYLLGDFNMNLLNNDTHNLTGEIYYLMTSNSFCHWLQDQQLLQQPWEIIYSLIIWKLFSFDVGVNGHRYCRSLPNFHVNRQGKAKDTEIYMEKKIYSDKNKRDFTQAVTRRIFQYNIQCSWNTDFFWFIPWKISYPA